MWNLTRGKYPFNRRIPLGCRGVSLVETLVAIMVLSIILFPLFISLTDASRSNRDAERIGITTYYTIGKMEEILALNFSVIPLSSPPGTPLPWPISDTVTIQGKTTNRDVYIDLYDENGDLTPESGLKKITVTVGDVTIDTLKADYPYPTF